MQKNLLTINVVKKQERGYHKQGLGVATLFFCVLDLGYRLMVHYNVDIVCIIMHLFFLLKYIRNEQIKPI